MFVHDHRRLRGVLVREDGGCVETFSGDVVPFAAALGLVGVVLALWVASRMARASQSALAARILLGLAALALLVPTALPIAGWAAAGFDLAIAREGPQGNIQCSGPVGGEVPLWLQTPTCVTWLDIALTTLGALAGILAAVAAARGSSRWAIAALVPAATALATMVVALAMRAASLDLVWLVPLAGAVLVAVALVLFARGLPAARSA